MGEKKRSTVKLNPKRRPSTTRQSTNLSCQTCNLPWLRRPSLAPSLAQVTFRETVQAIVDRTNTGYHHVAAAAAIMELNKEYNKNRANRPANRNGPNTNPNKTNASNTNTSAVKDPPVITNTTSIVTDDSNFTTTYRSGWTGPSINRRHRDRGNPIKNIPMYDPSFMQPPPLTGVASFLSFVVPFLAGTTNMTMPPLLT